MGINKSILVGAISGAVILIAAVLFLNLFQNLKVFYFLIGIAILVGFLPFVLASMAESRNQREKDEMFLEFSISLVESVESGTPISKSIVNLSAKDFGALSQDLEKLSNQIQLGIPLQSALETFANDTKSNTIIRAVTLIREADKTGGNIETILETVTRSVSEIEKLKEERRAAISSIVMEGYIIFFIFVVIMLVMETQILPMASGLTSGGGSLPGIGALGGGEGEGQKIDVSQFSIAFLSLLITQGFFAGLVIGKLSEGNIKAGIKHSFAMVAIAVILSGGVKLFM